MSYIADRRQEEKDRRRAEIVDAAESLYAEVGWDAVTMDSVARKARLSRALVYVYFKDKRDLHYAIAARAMEVLQARFIEASSRARTGLEKIEAIGRAYMAYGQEFPHYFDACARLQASVPEGTPALEASRAMGEAVHSIVIDALRIGQEDGSIRKNLGDLALTSRVLWGFTHGLIQIAMTKGELLAQSGIAVPQLTQHAIVLARQMLAAEPSRSE